MVGEGFNPWTLLLSVSDTNWRTLTLCMHARLSANKTQWKRQAQSLPVFVVSFGWRRLSRGGEVSSHVEKMMSLKRLRAGVLCRVDVFLSLRLGMRETSLINQHQAPLFLIKNLNMKKKKHIMGVNDDLKSS